MTSQITQLRVGDENFLVTSMIDRCPKSMMLRELVRNAIEAAQTALPGERLVEISAVLIDDVPKLSIWNSGRGMNPEELFRMCDIASSIRKQNRLDQNFGMGAKVASLPSNRLGMRYRSCHEGRVCEVMIGQRGGVYGRLRRELPGSDQLHDVLDVTEEALAEGRGLDADWTEVVLLGNRAEQNTLADPYDGQPGMVPYWIAEELHKKFFRLPEDVELILEAPANISAERYRFRSIAERLAQSYTRYEAVAVGAGAGEAGVVIHYIYDGPDTRHPSRSQASVGAPYFVQGCAGLVYKDEIYDLCWHSHWLHDGPVYGIPFLGRNITVLVEFPSDYPVLPDGYRQFVRRQDGLQAQVFLRQFAREVHAGRPGWLVELIQQSAPDSVVSEEITASLEQLLRELRVPRRMREVTAPARPLEPAKPVESATDEAADSAPDPASDSAADATQAPREMARDEASDIDFEPAPQIIMLHDLDETHARGVAERGARYYAETHQLFVNCLYPAVQAMQSSLEREFAWAGDQEAVRYGAQTSAEQSMVARVGRMLVFGLSKQGRWADWEMNHSLSTQALTLAADDYHQSLPAARASLRASLRLRQLSAPQPSR